MYSFDGFVERKAVGDEGFEVDQTVSHQAQRLRVLISVSELKFNSNFVGAHMHERQVHVVLQATRKLEAAEAAKFRFDRPCQHQ